MNANTVHTIFLALPFEEQKRVHELISNHINKATIINKPRKEKLQLISDEDCRNLLLEKIFHVKLKKS